MHSETCPAQGREASCFNTHNREASCFNTHNKMPPFVFQKAAF